MSTFRRPAATKPLLVQDAWDEAVRARANQRLLTLMVAITGLRIDEVLALRWRSVD